MKPLRILLFVGAVSASGIISQRSAEAVSIINWGGALGDTLFVSDGTALPIADFTFELGGFNGITPTESNIASWNGAWDSFSSYNFTTGDQFITQSATLSDNNTFAIGQTAYIWGFNTSSGRLPGPDAEFVLITGTNTPGGATSDANWFFPDATLDQTATPFAWRFSTAETIVFGGLNDEDGPGGSTPPPGTFDIQTAAAIPEPGTVSLFWMTGCLLLMRRRK